MASGDEEERKLKLLKSALNAGDRPHFDPSQREDISVTLRPDKNVSAGAFKPHPFMAKAYLAHPTTIRALKKDIFVAGQEMFEDLEELIHCESCKAEIDRQFWHFCPYCEASFRP